VELAVAAAAVFPAAAAIPADLRINPVVPSFITVRAPVPAAESAAVVTVVRGRVRVLAAAVSRVQPADRLSMGSAVWL